MNFREAKRLGLVILLAGLCASEAGAQVADPVLAVAGVNNSQQTITVNISDSTSSSTLYYTTDGTTPSPTGSTTLTITSGSTLNVSQNTTLKVVAYSGSVMSNLVTAQYTNLGLISSSGDHTVVLNKDGTISAWGDNTSGQLGIGYAASWKLPLQVQSVTGTPFAGANPVRMLVSTTQSGSRLRDLQAGDSFTMLWKLDGTVWTWGDDGRGQQGDSQAQNPAPFPQQVPNLTAVKSVAAAGDHALAAKSDGTVWAWGADDQSQGGDGGLSDLLIPTYISSLSNITAVFAGQFQGFAVDNYGKLYAWGTNDQGQLGDGTTNNQGIPELIKSPTHVPITGVTKVVSGSSHTLLLKSDGTVWASGSNADGQLGDGTNNNASYFQQVPGLANVVDIAAGGNPYGDGHSMALLANGTVLTWGVDWNGELGDGNFDPGSMTPEQVTLPPAKAVIAVDTKSFVILVDGTVRSFGGNSEGEMGIGNNLDQASPVEPTGISNVNLLAAGSVHTVVCTSTGAFYGWGDNTFFKLTQDFNNFARNTEVHDDSFQGFVKVASAQNTTIGLKSDHTVWAFGQGVDGTLGQGQNNWSSTERPIQITSLSNISQIAGGENDAFAIDNTGVLWAWGGNWDGQLGIGNNGNTNSPTQVLNVQNVIGVAGGDGHMLAVQSDGTVLATGDDTDGELGNGLNNPETAPIPVTALSGITAKAVAAGSNTSFVLDSNGTVWAWGKNDSRQLGLGTIGDVATPTAITTLPVMVAISAHSEVAMGIDISGNVWSWGGLGNTDGTPLMQPGLTNVTAIAAGYAHQLALESNGTLWGWGAAWRGQLGNGSYSNQSLPTQFNDVQGAVAIAANFASTFLVKQDGAVSGFGDCTFGQFAADVGIYHYSPKPLFGIALNETPPTVSITSPSTGTSFQPGTAVQFQCSATSSSGSISKVDYYLEGVNIGTSTTSGTWDSSYTPLSYGDYTFEAVAYDSAGVAMISAPLTIKVSEVFPAPQITMVSGTPQSGTAGAYLPDPFIVKVTDLNGKILPNFPVTFSVTQGKGVVKDPMANTPAAQIQVTTDTSGTAEAYFKQPLVANYTSTIAAIASDSAGQSSTSFTATTPADDGAPAAPSGLTVTSISATEIELFWTNNADNATSILIQQSTDGSNWTTVGSTDPTASSFDVNNLNSNQSYYFREAAVNNNGPGGTQITSPDGSDDPAVNEDAGSTSPQATSLITIYSNSGDNTDGFVPKYAGDGSIYSDGSSINGTSGAAWYGLPVVLDGTRDFEIDYDVYGNCDNVDSHIVMADDSTNAGIDVHNSPIGTDTPTIAIEYGDDLTDSAEFNYAPDSNILSSADTTAWPNNTWTHCSVTMKNNILTNNVGGQEITTDLSNAKLSTSTRTGIGYYGVPNDDSVPIYFRNIKVRVPPPELAVDADRNGTIVMANDTDNPANAGLPVDTTSATQPFRFWVNDGQNTAEDTAALYGDQVKKANETLGRINYKADLENCTRLWIYTVGLQSAIRSGAIKVALQWQNVTSGSPSINVYQAYESNGGTQYLNDDTTAGNQTTAINTSSGKSYGTAVAQVTGTSLVVLPTSLFSNLSSTNSKTYFLFEGTGVGVGELVLVLEDANGNVLGQGGPVYMSLKTVTDMFEQAQVKPPGTTDIANPYSFPGTGNWSSSTATNDANGPPSYAAGTNPTVGWNDITSANFEHPADETKDCILFVHGWNVTNQRYAQQSIECFKRLWLQNYKGLYAAIRWPGDVTGSDTGSPAVLAANAADYFEIEYRAFKYGGSVKQYTASLAGQGQGYSVGVVSHSMGAIVSSEALKEGANFEYALMDAAISSRCYDTSANLEITNGEPFTPPDLYTSGGYGGYFSGLSGLINFYNGSDHALTQSWQAANETAEKGETDVSGTTYVFTGGVGVQLKYTLGGAHPQYYYRDVFANGVTNYHESMAMYARTRTPAAGTEQLGGAISNYFDMQNYFLGSTAHSPQFDYNVQYNNGGTMRFYQLVLTELNFQ